MSNQCQRKKHYLFQKDMSLGGFFSAYTSEIISDKSKYDWFADDTNLLYISLRCFSNSEVDALEKSC